ncbi:aromatic amino acid transport protein AroP [Cutibacterium acnes JCM 18916]|nr:aromatic amino acid transport protein AroP [Cutibacterium acnes JCM 18916]
MGGSARLLGGDGNGGAADVLDSWKGVFLYIISIALISGVINWTMIIITNLKFRRRIGPEGVAALEFRMPGNPVTSYVVLVFSGARGGHHGDDAELPSGTRCWSRLVGVAVGGL